MRTHLFLAQISLVLLFVSCDILTNPPPPDRKNPIDPANPNYKQPKAEIISGPADNSTVSDTVVTFQWQGNQPDSVIRFSYRLDSNPWSTPDSSKQKTFSYLDEGVHTFGVKASYLTNIQQDTATSRTFTVDAVKGPALMLVPRKTDIALGSSQQPQPEIYVEEATDLGGAKIVIEYDNTKFDVDSVQVYDDARSILKKNGGTLVNFVDIDRANGVATLSLAVVGGSVQSVSGTGPVGKIWLKLKAVLTPQDLRINFASTSSLRDGNNNVVPIKALVSEVIQIR